jgi:hypothetical protein
MPRVLAGEEGDRASERPARDEPANADPETRGRANDEPRATVWLVPDATVWVWELRRSDEVIESCWEEDWTAYPSRADAQKAAEDRLAVRRAGSRIEGRQP